MTRIPLTRPSLGATELERIKQVLDSGMLVQGRVVRDFEEAIAAWLGVEFAIAVSTGTTAIHLALAAVGLGPGDEVIVPDFCFPSVAAAVLHTGATPVLCDVDPNTYNLDLTRVERALSPRTKAVLAVHQFGIPCGAGGLRDALDCEIIEDAACAFGARDEHGNCGTVGRAACFSFHPRKIITTAEGGVVTTSDPELAERVGWLRSHGMRRTPSGVRFAEIGYPGRMSEVHAAIGLAQMDRLESIISGRARAAALYRAAFADIEQVHAGPGIWHPGRVYQSLVVNLSPSQNRDRVVALLREHGIESTIGTYAIHRLPVFAQRSRLVDDGLEGSERCADFSVTLPLWPEMAANDVDRVVETLKQVLV